MIAGTAILFLLSFILDFPAAESRQSLDDVLQSAQSIEQLALPPVNFFVSQTDEIVFAPFRLVCKT
jgi:hypothetical protein